LSPHTKREKIKKIIWKKTKNNSSEKRMLERQENGQILVEEAQ
jgi:hypothetical protein